MSINRSALRLCLLFSFLFLFTGINHLSANAQTQAWKVYYYEDAQGSLTASDALKLFDEGKFRYLHQQVINPGFTESNFWLAIVPESISNSGELFVIRNPHINHLHWYEEKQQLPELKWTTGDYLPFRERPIHYTHFAFPINHEARVQLLKVDKRFESLKIPFQFISQQELQALDLKENLFAGAFIGSAMILLALSFSLYFNTRDKIYLFYLLHILFQMLWWISDTGLGYRYLWYDAASFTNRSRMLFTSLGMIFLIEFIAAFIQLKTSSSLSRLKTFFQILAAVAGVVSIMPLPFTEYPVLIYTLALGAAVNWVFMIVFVPYILIHQWRKGVKEVSVLALSYLPYLIFGIIFLFNHFGVITVSDTFLNFGLPLSNSITMTILLFGITMIFNRHRTENINLLMILNDQSKALTGRVLEAQETERQDLGKTLHDEVAAKLSVAQLNLSALKNVLDHPHHETFNAVHTSLADINTTIRNISHRLFSVGLEKYGLQTSLEEFFKSIQHAKTINIEYLIEGFSKVEQAPVPFKKSVYRIVLELINNIIKHASANHIFVQLIEVNNELTIFIEDDGSGFDTNRTRDGFGLQLLKTQTTYYKGALDIKSVTGKGTAITIEFTIPSNEATEHFYN